MKWNSDLYDQKLNFVSRYGEALLRYVPDDKTQRILDIGCGTGMLTAELADKSGYVLGIDASEDMIRRAKEMYPQVDFKVEDSLCMTYQEDWDVVFSNAVFHWIPDHNLLLQHIYQALKPHGLLVAEFGGYGNIATIVNAYTEVADKYGYQYKSRFNFQKAEDFNALLVKNGFTVDDIYDYDRPTPIKDEAGMKHICSQFFKTELDAIPEDIAARILQEMYDMVLQKLWNGKEWVADYRRLRVIAHKSLKKRELTVR